MEVVITLLAKNVVKTAHVTKWPHDNLEFKKPANKLFEYKSSYTPTHVPIKGHHVAIK